MWFAKTYHYLYLSFQSLPVYKCVQQNNMSTIKWKTLYLLGYCDIYVRHSTETGKISHILAKDNFVVLFIWQRAIYKDVIFISSKFYS